MHTSKTVLIGAHTMQKCECHESRAIFSSTSFGTWDSQGLRVVELSTSINVITARELSGMLQARWWAEIQLSKQITYAVWIQKLGEKKALQIRYVSALSHDVKYDFLQVRIRPGYCTDASNGA